MNYPNPNNTTITISGSTTSASGTIPASLNGNTGLEITNASDSIAFIRTSVGASTAVVTDYPVLPNSKRVFYKSPQHNTVSVILSTGTGNVYATIGTGF